MCSDPGPHRRSTSSPDRLGPGLALAGPGGGSAAQGARVRAPAAPFVLDAPRRRRFSASSPSSCRSPLVRFAAKLVRWDDRPGAGRGQLGGWAEPHHSSCSGCHDDTPDPSPSRGAFCQVPHPFIPWGGLGWVDPTFFIGCGLFLLHGLAHPDN